MTLSTTSPYERLLALAIAGLVAALVGCSQPTASDASESISQIGLLERLDSDSAPVLLDVRSTREFEAGHIPGAINIPHAELAERLDELGATRDSEVVVYCERGGRAEKALETLRGAGFSGGSHLEGDMQAWRGRELPCVGC